MRFDRPGFLAKLDRENLSSLAIGIENVGKRSRARRGEKSLTTGKPGSKVIKFDAGTSQTGPEFQINIGLELLLASSRCATKTIGVNGRQRTFTSQMLPP